jgi:hypothetical protein
VTGTHIVVVEPKGVRLNSWLQQRIWVALLAIFLSFALFSVSVIILESKVNENSVRLIELRYQSCIQDAELDFSVKQGDLVAAAFDRDQTKIAAAEIPYKDSLKNLHEVQTVCRVKFPAS